MISKVTTRHFKRFDDESFDLSEHLVLAGPNNSGKTTLLQAIVVWYLALQRWQERRGSDTSSAKERKGNGTASSAKERTGVPITRKDFTAIPLREMSLLWTNTQTALRQTELAEGQKQGHPKVMSITLEGGSAGDSWKLTFEFRYSSSEQIYVKPSADTLGDLSKVMAYFGLAQEPLTEFSRVKGDFSVVHVPPFSGIGAEETRYDQEYQNLLIGQGKPGDILRNLLYEVYSRPNGDWKELQAFIAEVFGCLLLPPEYPGRPFITCQYLPGMPSGKGDGGYPRLDISSAGSGFLQVLLLLAFIYARPTSLLMLDEPDAHLHVILQRQMYDRIRSLLVRRKCQMIVATHSEVLIDSTDPKSILSFYGKPHHLILHPERDQVREALKRLNHMDLLLADGRRRGILYTEGESDFNLLRAWAAVLNHPLADGWFLSPFWNNNHGRNPREARNHFFALRAIKEQLGGYLLLDGDNRNLPDRELTAEALRIGRWRRYEAESYLIHPEALRRYLESRGVGLWAAQAEQTLSDELPPAVIRDPLGDHDYLAATPASKTLLPAYFRAADLDLPKNEYYLIAEQMRPEEIHPEVSAKLDDIASIVL